MQILTLDNATIASAPTVRAVVAFVVALSLAAAPTAGAAWLDRPSGGGAAETGAMAGVVPLAADPGHRMGGASSSTPQAQLQDVAPARRAASGLAAVLAAAAPMVWPQQAWLDRMLVGARMQTDGG